MKERTKICSIHYHKLVEEEWERSHARKKLDKVLFIYFIYNAKDKLNSKVVKADLWKLNEISERTIIRDDWVRVKDKVAAGFAHELSESQSYILAASRTGQGRGRDEVTQPNSSKLALKRAFSLKQSYTKQRWEEISEGKEFVSILTQLHGATARNFIELFIKKLHEYQGVTLKDFARRFRIKVPRGKSAAATIVKKAIGFKNVGAPIKELDQLGIEVKVIPVRTKDLQPYEAVSFPAFVMNELVMEKWEEAELMEDLDSILFIPLLRWHRKTDKSLSTIGKAFIWSPSEEEWNIIEREWGQYRREIQQGKARTGLTKAPATQIIHVRPHAQNKDDVDIDPFGNKVVKQSFWLNKTFIAKLVQENLGEVKIGTR